LIAIVVGHRAISRAVHAASNSVARRNKAPVGWYRANLRREHTPTRSIATRVQQTNVRGGASDVCMVASSLNVRSGGIRRIAEVVGTHIIVVARVGEVRVVASESSGVGAQGSVKGARVAVIAVDRGGGHALTICCGA